jgi:hypothetical protein
VRDLISKVTKSKKAGGIAQVVEYLPSKCKALNSKPSIDKNKNREKGNR